MLSVPTGLCRGPHNHSAMYFRSPFHFLFSVGKDSSENKSERLKLECNIRVMIVLWLSRSVQYSAIEEMDGETSGETLGGDAAPEPGEQFAGLEEQSGKIEQSILNRSTDEKAAEFSGFRQPTMSGESLPRHSCYLQIVCCWIQPCLRVLSLI